MSTLPPAPVQADVAGQALPAAVALPNATERLKQSRERIRQYFESRRPRTHSAAEAGDAPPWLDKLRANPLFDGVADAVSGWWRTHPLRSVFMVAETGLREGVAPFARRHPLALAAGAVLLGALLYRTRLLRRLLKPALFAGLATQIATQMIQRIPLESVFDALARFRPPPASDNAPPVAEADRPGAATPPR